MIRTTNWVSSSVAFWLKQYLVLSVSSFGMFSAMSYPIKYSENFIGGKSSFFNNLWKKSIDVLHFLTWQCNKHKKLFYFVYIHHSNYTHTKKSFKFSTIASFINQESFPTSFPSLLYRILMIFWGLLFCT